MAVSFDSDYHKKSSHLVQLLASLQRCIQFLVLKSKPSGEVTNIAFVLIREGAVLL